MTDVPGPGTIVVLNGAPRSGKSSIARAIQETFDGAWLNIGVDAMATITPARLLPGIGLRPGGERPDLEPAVRALYPGLYDAIAAFSGAGLNVVADVGHHDDYATLRGLLGECARRLDGLPAWFVGVRCGLDEIMRRRAASQPGRYAVADADGSVPPPVLRWQEADHRPGIYDLEVDTTRRSPVDCAAAIRALLQRERMPTAFRQLASRHA